VLCFALLGDQLKTFFDPHSKPANIRG